MLATDEVVRDALSDVQVALGVAPADLLLKDCRLVNVWSEEIHVTNIAIRGSRIVALRQDYQGTAAEVIECAGRFALPGFIEPIAALPEGMSLGALAAILVPHGITSVILANGAAIPAVTDDTLPLRVWQRGDGRGGWGTTVGRARPLQPERTCSAIGEIVDAIEHGIAVLLDAGFDPEGQEALLRAIADARVETGHLMFRHCGASGGAMSLAVKPMLAAALRAGVPLHGAIQMMGFNTATHYGIEHEAGSITPGRKADILLYDELTSAFPASVIIDGTFRVRGGDAVQGGH